MPVGDKIKIIEQETIENPSFNLPPNRRIDQKGLLPTAIKNRLLGDIVLLSATASSSATISNGQQATFTITTASISNQRIMNVEDIALYVGSVADANQLPGGSAIDESQWQVIFMGNDWNSTDDNNVVNIVYVRNISAGASKDVLIRAQSRVIVNTAIA